MTCQACAERGKNWEGDDPTCAFPGGLAWFPDNWRCATDGMIRDIVDRDDLPDGVTYRYCDDQKYATIDVSEMDLEYGRALTLWVTWYKSRGRTENMWLLSEMDLPRRPTETDLLTIAKHYGKK